jgi:hypothetical protein
VGRGVVAGAGGRLSAAQRPETGKITLTRGLRRLLELLTTGAILTSYLKEHGTFPAKVAALLRVGNPQRSYEWIAGESHNLEQLDRGQQRRLHGNMVAARRADARAAAISQTAGNHIGGFWRCASRPRRW